eukprot:scaffold279775_cov28-Tisochrysis_lutea.AAC.2
MTPSERGLGLRGNCLTGGGFRGSCRTEGGSPVLRASFAFELRLSGTGLVASADNFGTAIWSARSCGLSDGISLRSAELSEIGLVELARALAAAARANASSCRVARQTCGINCSAT